MELLVDRPTSQGYAFQHNTDAHEPIIAGFIPASSGAEDLVEWLDRQSFGPIPAHGLVLDSAGR